MLIAVKRYELWPALASRQKKPRARRRRARGFANAKK